MSSKRATEWETPPPTPLTPAASAGAAAVAAPGKDPASHCCTWEICGGKGPFTVLWVAFNNTSTPHKY